MAGLYVHRGRGWQVRFTLYFPGGTTAIRYRYARKKTDADELLRLADFLERGSRAENLNPREISVALHHRLLSDDDARRLSRDRCLVPVNLERVVARYSEKKRIDLRPYAYEVDARRVATWLSWLNDHPLGDLTESDVRRYILDRRSGALRFRHRITGAAKIGVSDKTIAHELGTLKGLLDEAVALGMVPGNVATAVTLPLRHNRARRSLDLDGVRSLLAAAEQNRHLCHGLAYELVAVALYTGLRRSEIRTLTWADIDLDAKRITIQAKTLPTGETFAPKSGEVGFTTIPDILLPVLAGIDRQGRFVFGGDAPIPGQRLYKTFKTLLARAGLPDDLSLHHARHTYGSFLLKLSGGNLRYVQAEMRHLDIASTKNYMHNVESEGPASGLDFGRPGGKK